MLHNSHKPQNAVGTSKPRWLD